ncbi:MAG: hypothetical protein Q7J48_06020 [Nocardioides sp.]|nr:hypothetical protein [Nocardioides sp.]
MSARKEPAAAASAVNLLSPWVLEGLRVRRLRQRFGVAAVVVLVLIAGGWTFQRLQLEQTRADLHGERAVTTGLQRQIEDLGEIRTYVQGVQHRASTVQDAMFTQVSFSQVLRALEAATPRGVRIESISVTLPVAGSEPAAGVVSFADPEELEAARGLDGASCPGPDPFGTKVVVGCLDLTGTAGDRDQVGRLVINLGREGLFVEPFVSTTTTGDGTGVSFTGSVALSPQVFSRRYDDLTGLLTKEAS